METFSETTKGHHHEENQDAVKYSKGVYIICDGHGSNGKQVANFVANTLHGMNFVNIEKCETELVDGKITKERIQEIFKKI